MSRLQRESRVKELKQNGYTSKTLEFDGEAFPA
jgi:hypothetical protein